MERSPSVPDVFPTLPQISQLPRIAKKTVYPIAKYGAFPASEVRQQCPFRQDLDSWMAAQVKGPDAPEQPEAKPRASTRKGGMRR